jgi:hypothetical protein
MSMSTSKYTIEGNLDFYSELYKSLDENPKEEMQNNNNEDVCLITNMPLTQYFVTLECKHKFNYLPIFNEVQNQKLKINSLNIVHLDHTQIMCPYCRAKNNHILPFHEELKVNKIYGINTLDTTYKLPIEFTSGKKTECVLGSCAYTSGNADSNHKCNNKWVYNSTDDGKMYCYKHKLIILTTLMAAKKQKEKAAKMAAKAAQLATKAAAKISAKEAKEALKHNIPSAQEVATCPELLKSGKNKGLACGCKIVQNGKCGRHFKPPVAGNVGENLVIG